MWRRIGFLIAMSLAALGVAQAEPSSAPGHANSGELERAESPWRLGIALGYGSRTNPLIQSDDIPLVVDLDIAWFGSRWFFDNGDLGVAIWDDARFTTNLIARVNSDRVFFGKTNTRFVSVGAPGGPLVGTVLLEPPDRDYAIEVGAEMLFDGRWGELQLSAFQDVSGTHRGHQAYAEYRYAWQLGRLRFSPSLGLHYKSRALNDYYWGVRPDEANIALPAYEVASGVNVVANLQSTYYLSKRMRIAVAVNYEQLDSAVRASPIVDERAVFGYFAGLSYSF